MTLCYVIKGDNLMIEQFLSLQEKPIIIPEGNTIFYFDPVTRLPKPGLEFTGTVSAGTGVVTTDAYKIYNKETVRIPAETTPFNIVLSKLMNLTGRNITIEFTSKFDTVNNRQNWSNLFTLLDPGNTAHGLWARFANGGVLDESLNVYTNYNASINGQGIYYAAHPNRADVWNKESKWALVINGDALSIYHNGKRVTFTYGTPTSSPALTSIPINRASQLQNITQLVLGFYSTTPASGMPGYMGPIKITDTARYTGPTYPLTPY